LTLKALAVRIPEEIERDILEMAEREKLDKATAKRGRKRIYRPSPEAQDEEAFRRALAGRFIDKTRTELAGDAQPRLRGSGCEKIRLLN
jgi:hypothetical protein